MATSRISTTSKTQLAYAVETELGKLPAGTATRLRITGESLNSSVEKDSSKEIDPSRQVGSMFLTNAQVQGAVNFELSAQEFDTLFAAVLMGEWSTFGTNGVVTGTEVSIDATAGTLTFGSEVDTSKLVVGQFLSLSGTSLDSRNARPVRIKSIAGQVVTYEGATLYDQSGVTADVSSSRVENGDIQRSFSLEKLFSDKWLYYIYQGMQASKLTLTFSSRTVVTGSIEFIGLTSDRATTASFTAPYTDSFTNSVINTVKGVENVLIDGKSVKEYGAAGVKSFELTFDNSMEGQEGFGVLGNVDVLLGDIACSFTMEMYADNGGFYDAALDQTRFDVSIAAFDSNGHGYAFTMPSVEFNAVDPQAGSKGQALTVSLTGTALKHPTLKKTMFIDRF